MRLSISSLISLPWRIFRYATRTRIPAEVIQEPADPPTVHIDVTRIAEKDIRTGIQRVVRQISRHWYRLPGRKISLNFVQVNEYGSLENAREWASSTIDVCASEDKPVLRKGDIYFALDLVLPPRGLNPWQFRWLKKSGVHIVFMVYDLLPITHPQFFRLSSRISFKWWMRHLVYADQLVTISHSTKRSIERFSEGRFGTNNVGAKAVVLPMSGEPEEGEWVLDTENEGLTHPGGRLFISIGTIEPRKGYDQTLEAFERVWSEGGDAHWWILGSKGWKVEKFIRKFTRHPEFGKRLRWHQSASDSSIHKAMTIADSLIINSKAEGLGLPVLEAQHHGLEVIARETEVFQEFARDRATFVEDGTWNSIALATVIYKNLSTSRARHLPFKSNPMNGKWSDTVTTLENLFA